MIADRPWPDRAIAIAHGPRAGALRAVFLSRGFAFAESAYSADGWAVKEGVEDTEALRRHFVAKYGLTLRAGRIAPWPDILRRRGSR